MRSDLRPHVVWLAALITLVGVTSAGPLMAVDFGSDFIKVAVVPPGKLPEIVTNEMSKRRTSAQVAIVDGNRLLGEEAAALGIRYPTKVYSRLRDWAGKSATDSSVTDVLEKSLLPFSIAPDPTRGTVTVKTDTQDSLSSEELVVSFLLSHRLVSYRTQLSTLTSLPTTPCQT